MAAASGLSYYLGFAPPRWLRHTWQLAELHHFLRQTSGRVTHSQNETFQQLATAALRTVGGAAAAVANWDLDQERLKIELPGSPPLQAGNLESEESVVGRAWRDRQAQVARVPGDLGLETVDWANQIGAQGLFLIPIISPLRPWGLLIVALRYAPLFAQDDLELLTLLAEHSAIALDYSALIAELRVSNQSLEVRVAERTVELSKVNRALRTISDCNQELVRAESEDVLLSRICNIIVTTGGYQMAWVGYAEQDEAKSIRPAQWAGVNEAFFKSFNISWADDDRGRVPMGKAIRTGQPTVFHLSTDESYGPWREAALQRGFAACIALPLLNDDRTFGGLGIFADDPLAFDEAEVKLLVELANDLAYGIIALRTQAAHKHIAEALRQSDEMLRQTNRMAKVGGWALDLTTMIPTWSEETYRIHEVDPATQPDLENAINFYAPEARPIISKAVQKAMDEGTPYDLKLPFITATGRRIWVRTQGRAEFKDGKCVRLSGTFQDISELYQIQAELNQSQEQLASIIGSAMDGIITVDDNQRIVVFNTAAESMFQYSGAEVIGQPLDRLIPERFRATHSKHIHRFGETGVTNRAMGTLNALSAVRADGTEFPIEASISQSRVNDRVFYTVILRDVTDRKRAEDALRQSEDRFVKAFRASPGAMTITRLSDGTFIDVNDSFLNLFGYSRDEVIGQQSTGLNMFLDLEARTKAVNLLRQQGFVRNYELKMCTKSGQARDVMFSTELLELDGQTHALAILFDITDRKRAEAELLKSEERFSKAFRVSPAALTISSLSRGLFVDVNDSFLRMYGYERDEVIGHTSADLNRMIDPDERAAMVKQLSERGTLQNYELNSHKKSGEPLIVLLSTELIELDDVPHILAIQYDITDRKQAEAQLHETMLKLERNNRELQDFAYVASHDLQEPLRKIRAFGDRLQARAGPGLDETSRDYVERMQVAAKRMQTLIEDLLTFSRVTTKAQPFVRTDLNPIVRDVLGDLEIRIEQTGAQVEIEPLPILDADPVQMRQVFQNLIGNAIKFHKPETKPLVKVWGKANNGQCLLYVSDNGIGFEEKYLDRIFTPFQRLHGRSEYEGTGIGLAVVRKIVERHSGDVTAQSQPGEGATFIVTLPVHQSR